MFAVFWIQAALVASIGSGCSRSESRTEPGESHGSSAAAAMPREAVPERAAVAADAALPPPAALPEATQRLDAELDWYRMVAIIGDASDMPFAIGIHPERPEGWIASDTERLPIIVIKRSPLVLRIPVRGAELRLTPNAGGQLRGQWIIH
jgi:hypothetical protein